MSAQPEPVEAAPEPVEAAPEPLEAAPKPLEAAPEPLEAAPEPLEAAPEPLEVLPVPDAAAPRDETKPERLPRVPSPHSGKFRIALGMLCGIAVGAIAIAVVVATQSSSRRSSGGAAWSQWSPGVSGSTGVQEIADYIAPFYRLTASQQLDVVTPVSLTSETAAGTTTGSGLTVALNASGSSSSDSLSLLTGKTVAFNICGLGASNCELAGTPTTSRMLLLRREALELALYTFKYISTSQNVLVVLPPGHTVATNSSTKVNTKATSGPSGTGKSAASGSTTSESSATTTSPSKTSASKTSTSKTSSGASTSSQPITVAVLFLRQELTPLLKVPIDHSLTDNPPNVAELPTWVKSDEAGLVDQITARGLFASQIESQQEGGNLLVLSPLPPQ